MKKNTLSLMIFCILSAICISCSESSSQKVKSNRKTTQSALWELLLVTDKEWIKTSEGELFMNAMNTEIPGLNQSEPCFKVLCINPRGFSKSYQVFANIVIAEFGSKYEKAEMKIAHDQYAHPQTVLYISAPTGKELAEYTEKHRDEIMEIFTRNELAEIQSGLKRKHSKKVMEQARKQFNISIFAPVDIDAVKEGKDFFWASSLQTDNHLNLCLYTIPLRQFNNIEEIIAIRDSVMQKNVQGEKENQYVKTVPFGLYITNIMKGSDVVTEIRGLWQMENDMMGGPFIMHVQADSINDRLIFSEGFVYAPEKKKRNYIRSLEASLRTLTQE